MTLTVLIDPDKPCRVCKNTGRTHEMRAGVTLTETCTSCARGAEIRAKNLADYEAERRYRRIECDDITIQPPLR